MHCTGALHRDHFERIKKGKRRIHAAVILFPGAIRFPLQDTMAALPRECYPSG